MEGWKACGDPAIVIILGGFWEDILLLGDSLHLSFLSDSRAFTCFDRSSFCFFDIIKSVSKSAQFSTSMRRSFCISSCLRFISASLKFKSFVSNSGIFLSCSVALHLRQDPPSLSCRSLNDFYNFTTLSKSISVMQASRSWFSFDSFVFLFSLSSVDWWVMVTEIWNKKRTWVSASVKCAHYWFNRLPFVEKSSSAFWFINGAFSPNKRLLYNFLFVIT